MNGFVDSRNSKYAVFVKGANLFTETPIVRASTASLWPSLVHASRTFADSAAVFR